MVRSLLTLFILVSCFAQINAQTKRKANPPVSAANTRGSAGIQSPKSQAVPAAGRQYGLPSPERTPLPPFQPNSASAARSIKMIYGEQGLPIFFQGVTETTSAAESATAAALAVQYIGSLRPQGIDHPEMEFIVRSTHTDEQGNFHVRLQQHYQNVPVYGAELMAHTQNGVFNLLNGRYYPTPQLATVTPAVDETAAIAAMKNNIPDFQSDWTAEELALIGGETARTQLVVYFPNRQTTGARLCWHIEAHPNLLNRVVYFIDAQTAELVHHFDHTCRIDGGRLHHHGQEEVWSEQADMPSPDEALVGSVDASGVDLLGVNRNFGAWMVSGSQFVLEDAKRAMFNDAASTMPNDPVGAIITLDALNTSPQNQFSFDYDFVKSSSATFNNTTAVSGHYNSIESYEYFRTKFNRNSIDGAGGNIIAFVNVSESDGSSMENAFWNGAAMWYGNGGSFFKKLARGLDVGGHEMTHGVVEKTANLEYENESGALNESFADVFGAMIDPDDWKIGEDVMQAGVSPGGCLRSLQDPHNSANSSSPFWQPKHIDEKYNGTDDNGGVHINSGIPNHAYYLFATNAAVGNAKAEQVYYKALRDYLVKSSQFVDCRIAVIQAANDLYGSAVANAAAAAFDAVGIGGSQPGGNYLGELTPNPGTEYLLCVSQDGQNLHLGLSNGTVLTPALYTEGIGSRPSVSDDGRRVVFVNAANHIIYLELTYSNGQIGFEDFQLSNLPEWRNAAISKDGRFLAALKSVQENTISIFDLTDSNPVEQIYELYNPTYSQEPVTTGEVQYADVLEFDYSGESIMYDAFNELTNQQGVDISYWDIGFLRFWENGDFVNPSNASISKLFNGLPENTSVGNPSFAKNSSFVIAFDVFDEFQGQYEIYAANLETGDVGGLVTGNTDFGWPVYNKSDNAIMLESNIGVTGAYSLYQQSLLPSKIEPAGDPSLFISNYFWGVWFANGDRSLMVDAGDLQQAPFSLALTPNPTNGPTLLVLEADEAMTVQVQVCDLLGAVGIVRSFDIQAGRNTLDINLTDLPSGAYIVRVNDGRRGAAVKLIKH